MNANEPKEIMNANNETTTKTALPTWCKAVFVIDVILLVLTSTMFIRILTGSWQESLSKEFFGEAPAVLQSAYINVVITLLLVVVGITANVFLLKLRRMGVILGFVALSLVLLAIAVQLWGASYAKNSVAMSFQTTVSIFRIIYNGIYLLALLKIRKVVNSEMRAA